MHVRVSDWDVVGGRVVGKLGVSVVRGGGLMLCWLKFYLLFKTREAGAIYFGLGRCALWYINTFKVFELSAHVYNVKSNICTRRPQPGRSRTCVVC